MLPDSGHIQEIENEIKNKKRKRAGKKEMLEPIYTAQDAIDCMEIFKGVDYDKIIDITPSISVRFNDAGHMLGSAIIEVFITEKKETKKIVFTGDLGNNDISLLSAPTMISNADYLVMESTYGDRLHLRNNEKAEMFLDIVSETIEDGGTVVIPSFAVGRTQEILYELNKIKDQHKDDKKFQKEYKELMEIPVYVDSPLATSATEVFKKNIDLFSHDIQQEIMQGDNPLEFSNLRFTQSVEESKALNESTDPCIIISASGMCDAGRIKHHLKHNIWNPNSTILFVGYQAPGTLGNRIVSGAKEVKVLGEEFAVRARIEYIEGYSGHADQDWLMNFIYSFTNPPKHVFLVHGEPKAQETLKSKIEENTPMDVVIPNYGEEYTLGDDLSMKLKYENYAHKQIDRIELLDKMQNLEQELEDMKHALKEDIRIARTSDKQMAELNNRVSDLRKQIIEIMKSAGGEDLKDDNK